MLSENKSRFKELDALRGIAALLVVFFHLTFDREVSILEYDAFFKYGTTGVDLFFIISGFVIFMSLKHTNRAVDFTINRVSRLYPTYWFAVTATCVLIFVHLYYEKRLVFTDLIFNYLTNLTMFQFYFNVKDLDGPYWTLIIEMLFYIWILGLYKMNVLKYINGIGVGLCMSLLIAVSFFNTNETVLYTLSIIPLLQFFPLFFAGIIFFKIYDTQKNRFLYYAIIVLCIYCQYVLFPYAGRSRSYISHSEYSVMLCIYFILFTLLVNMKLRWIVNAGTIFLGKISYALYLTHQYISWYFIIPLFERKLGFNFWIVIVCIDLPILILIAAFITYKIEIPYSKKMKMKLQELLGR